MLHGHHRIKLEEKKKKKTKKLDKIYVYDVYAHVQMRRDQTGNKSYIKIMIMSRWHG